MITLTLKDLVSFAQSGVLRRFFACSLKVDAWKKLRHTADSCEKEMQAFNKKRDELVKKYEGKPTNDGSTLDFGNDEAAKNFAVEWNELMACTVEIVGEPISSDDITAGSLSAADAFQLKSFLTD